MGQQEVIDLLEKQEGPLSCREIAELLEWSFIRTSKIVSKLLKDPFLEIEVIEISPFTIKNWKIEYKKYKTKKGVRLFSIKHPV